MIQIIDSKYCKDDFVQYSPYIGKARDSNLIISPDEIILLNSSRNCLINKHPESMLINGYCPQLFEYDKIYLHYNYSHKFGYNPERLKLEQSCFAKYFNKTLRLGEYLSIDSTTKSELEVMYDDIKKIFEPSSYVSDYDSIYILRDNGDILFASNKKDGCIIENKVFSYKKNFINLGLLKHSLYIPAAYIITSKNGQFNIKHFQFRVISSDKFVMSTNDIPVVKPILDIDYCLGQGIEYYSGIYPQQKIKKK